MNNIKFLRIPLYKLYHINDLSLFSGLSESSLKNLSSEYSSEEINEILLSIEWAIKNPKQDFKSMLPDIPFTNGEILDYLKIIHKQIGDLISK